ncbi:MAG: hypothetical protein IJ814_07020 [Paludibacteraceae bacterium]|nr:hypothetical protein [Paludibacteraceae bacterium]
MINCPSCGAPIDEHEHKCPYCESDLVGVKTDHIRKKCIDLLNNGFPKKAINLYQRARKCSKDEAIKYIENLIIEESIDVPSKKGVLIALIILALCFFLPPVILALLH